MKRKQRECQGREIAIYSRKSKFTGKGESIENQIELCKRYIEAAVNRSATDESDRAENTDRLTIKIYEDEGFSGGNLERPQFKMMMRDARQGKLSKVVVYRLDRISRNIGDFAVLIEELNRLGVAFISIKEQFDTSSPMGRAMMYIASVFSQLERETIAERIRDNMLELAKTGRWLGGRTPTGYASESVATVTVDGRTKKCCKLKVIPEEAELVREIFHRYLECRSLKETAEKLNQAGRKTKTGKPFTTVAVKAILSNPVYASADGEIQRYFSERSVPLFFMCDWENESQEKCSNGRTAGDRRTGNDGMTGTDGKIETDSDEINEKFGILAYNRTLQRPGESSRMRRAEEWIVAVGKHEPLVSGRDWVKVQMILQKNGQKSRPKQTDLYL